MKEEKNLGFSPNYTKFNHILIYGRGNLKYICCMKYLGNIILTIIGMALSLSFIISADTKNEMVAWICCLIWQFSSLIGDLTIKQIRELMDGH